MFTISTGIPAFWAISIICLVPLWSTDIDILFLLFTVYYSHNVPIFLTKYTHIVYNMQMKKSSVILAFLLIFSLTSAKAHEWYDGYCCSNQDCRPIESCSEIQELDEGRLKWNGYIFRKDSIKPSQDSKCHVCIHQGNPLCIYIQQNS